MIKALMMSEKDQRFWDKIAPKYFNDPIKDEKNYQVKLNKTQALLKEDMHLLEFGCGTGGTALKHANQVAHIDAIDISPNMIEIAEQQKKEAKVDNVDFKVSTLEKYYPKGRLDMVLGLSILHLLKDYKGAIEKTHNLLKPSGYFVTSTVCLKDVAPYLKWIAPLLFKFGLLPRMTFFSADQLKQDLKDAGFTIIDEHQLAKKKSIFIIAQKNAALN